jgi:hypothetical protein
MKVILQKILRKQDIFLEALDNYSFNLSYGELHNEIM